MVKNITVASALLFSALMITFSFGVRAEEISASDMGLPESALEEWEKAGNDTTTPDSAYVLDDGTPVLEWTKKNDSEFYKRITKRTTVPPTEFNISPNKK